MEWGMQRRRPRRTCYCPGQGRSSPGLPSPCPSCSSPSSSPRRPSCRSPPPAPRGPQCRSRSSAGRRQSSQRSTGSCCGLRQLQQIQAMREKMVSRGLKRYHDFETLRGRQDHTCLATASFRASSSPWGTSCHPPTVVK